MDSSRSEDKGKKRVYPRLKRTTTSVETGESSKQSDGDKNGETTVAAAAGSSSSNTQVPTEEATKYGYYSFPPFPDSEPEDNEAATLPPKSSSGPDESPSLATRVRSFFRTPSNDAEEQKKKTHEQPPRTGVFLWCKHAFEDPCRCRNQLPPGDRGDYCERCWLGACPGPAIP